MKTNTTIAIVLLFICILFVSSENRNLKDELEVLRAEKLLMDEMYAWKSKRLANYLKITIRLNEITNKYQSSRQEKLKDKELIQLMSNQN